ncbi:2-amino-4-hydroxy-6-hydroxymethyldihydropteridine diphosphokinase [Fusibacter sp. JL298sf-3]
MHKVYLGLGSNIEPKRAHLDSAVKQIEASKGVCAVTCSPYYETAPVGYLDQASFVNAVVCIETTLLPLEVLSICQAVETALKRERLIRWGPRTIDVDVLLYDDFVSDDPELTIPHPRMHERGFVLTPLAALDETVSFKGKTVRQWLDELEGENTPL